MLFVSRVIRAVGMRYSSAFRDLRSGGIRGDGDCAEINESGVLSASSSNTAFKTKGEAAVSEN